MTAKRHERTRARRAALQVLYSSEITDVSPVDVAEAGCYLSDGEILPDYAEKIVGGVTEHHEDIDRYLVATSENWSLNRMPIVDRSILRLATYEMLYVADVPASVAINEAVELAKDFGGEDESPRFVNGVLGRIAQRLEKESSADDAVADSTTGSRNDSRPLAMAAEMKPEVKKAAVEKGAYDT